LTPQESRKKETTQKKVVGIQAVTPAEEYLPFIDLFNCRSLDNDVKYGL
jgi:hypothetical protein